MTNLSMQPQVDQTKNVGPVLREGLLSEAIVATLCEENPGAQVLNNGAYFRISVPLRCQLTRFKVEERIGRPFHLRTELEQIMFSFVGDLRLTDEEAVWELKETSL